MVFLANFKFSSWVFIKGKIKRNISNTKRNEGSIRKTLFFIYFE